MSEDYSLAGSGLSNGSLREVIILAGGVGTRLHNVLPGVPKTLAPIQGRPFLFYLINYLRSQGITKFIFSLGYKHEMIRQYLDEHFSTLDYTCSLEKEPLGTGGAILASCYKTKEENILVVNGDTFYKASISGAAAFHVLNIADCTLLVKPMTNFDRYGAIELNSDRSIHSFREKQFFQTGFINAGMYILNTPRFLEEELPVKFSFEKDYLEKLYSQRRMFGVPQDNYFIDIGIPEDYKKAQEELQRNPPDLKKIDKSWTVFLDRDGVINHDKKDDYIHNWEEFQFYNGTEEAIRLLSEKAGYIIVVTNQRGVGKGLMTEDDLNDIHEKMKASILNAGGRIDGIYYCTATDTLHPDRKPNPGMVFRAAGDFPGIDLSKAIIAGNNQTDMQMGRNAFIYTAFITTSQHAPKLPHPDIDFSFNSLLEFAKTL